jgi:hypothetical protein
VFDVDKELEFIKKAELEVVTPKKADSSNSSNND